MTSDPTELALIDELCRAADVAADELCHDPDGSCCDASRARLALVRAKAAVRRYLAEKFSAASPCGAD